ncbi:MAG: glycosyltransferase [Candidatus Woesearchaeota archaeon]|nr:glycosyltransferase [Nanoarchaeota archaeon]USN44155.1 MAG: glycosyltransferase [Candidatus Woesearchaeota archaeon]
MTSTFPRWEGDAGTPPFVLELSKRLGDTFEVHLLAPFSKGSQKEEIVKGIHVHRFKYWFTAENNLADGAILPNLKKNKLLFSQIPPFFLAQIFAARKILKKENIKTIHAHWIIPQGFVAAICKTFFVKDCKIVITTHGADIFGLKKMNGLKKWTLSKASKLTVVSNAIKTEAQKIGYGDEIEVIPMGVDLSAFSPDKKDKSLREKYAIKGEFLLFVGRLAEKKGITYLLDAMPKIIEKHKDCKLLIVGSGPLEKELKEQAKKLKLEQHVLFTGPIQNSELPRYYASADIFVGPSIVASDGDTEGFGLVFVEAMGSGTLVVTTDLPAIQDIVENEKTGYIGPQKDSISLAKVLLSCLEDKKKANSVALAGKKYVEKFDWKNIAKRYNEVLTE